MLVMVGLVAVVLVIAGAGSLILTRNEARNQAQQQLVSEAESLTSSKAATQRLDVLAAIRKTLKLEDADLITITALGNVVTTLPDGLTEQDIDVAGLQSGQTSSGRKGSLVYAAAPVTLTQAETGETRQGGASPPSALPGHTRRPPDARRRRPRAELGVLHRRRGSGPAGGRPGGLADVAPDGPPSRRGHGGHRPHRRG